MEHITRLKFRCTEVAKTIGGVYNAEGKYESTFLYAYKFAVVIADTPENKSFFASTPVGSLSFASVRNDLFEVGKEYYLDITPANANA